MWAFPGGRVDPEDVDPARPDDEVATARRAAVREAVEEADVALDGDALVPFAHWVPPTGPHRRFATWFFLARDPALDVTVDGHEIHEHRWMRPVDVLAARDRGEVSLAPPTWVTLWRLANAVDVDGAIAEATTTHPERFQTRIGQEGDTLLALWHGDAGYDDGDTARPGPRHRLWMLDGGWRYERTTAAPPRPQED
jgi:8-oxo-dGTP pyrophosphatase MutT (NUDIX family)